MRSFFHIGYALKTIRADRSYALLAVLLIVVGTGSLAATLSLGRALVDNMTLDVRRAAGGDVVAQAWGEPFTSGHLAQLRKLQQKGRIEEFSAQVTMNEAVKSEARSSLATYWFIDPKTYPLYGEAPQVLNPAGKAWSLLCGTGLW